MKLCMIGTGYVGLVSGVCLSDIGNTVYCVDKDQKKIDLLNKCIVPIYEPGLEEILKKNFKQKSGKGGEIHITDAIQKLISENNKFIAHNFSGKYLDCGSMNGYINSTLEISKS